MNISTAALNVRRTWHLPASSITRALAWALVPSVAALTLAAVSHARVETDSGTWAETNRVRWGAFEVVREDREPTPSEGFAEREARHRVVDASGHEHAVITNHASVTASFTDVDGDAVVDLVLSGYSGGVGGCCSFIEVWSIASGAPERAFFLWGGRDPQPAFVPLPRGTGQPVPIRATQWLYMGEIPYCCLPSVPRAFLWDGDSFRDVTRSAIPALVSEALGESLATVRYLSRSPQAESSIELEAAAIRAYAAAVILGADVANRELRTLRELLPDAVFSRLAGLTMDIEDAVTNWIWRLGD